MKANKRTEGALRPSLVVMSIEGRFVQITHYIDCRIEQNSVFEEEKSKNRYERWEERRGPHRWWWLRLPLE